MLTDENFNDEVADNWVDLWDSTYDLIDIFYGGNESKTNKAMAFEWSRQARIYEQFEEHGELQRYASKESLSLNMNADETGKKQIYMHGIEN